MKFDWAKKVIIVDYDGVLVDFTQAFDWYLFDKGYYVKDLHPYDVGYRYEGNKEDIYEEMHNFVHSEEFKYMPPISGAIPAIKTLRDMGWAFHCITAAPKERLEDRIFTAENLFGKGIFQSINCIGLNNCKRKYLEKYAGSNCFWVEDKPSNAELGLEFGLRPILMHHSYNELYKEKEGVYRVKDWNDLLEYIMKEENETKF